MSAELVNEARTFEVIATVDGETDVRELRAYSVLDAVSEYHRLLPEGTQRYNVHQVREL